MKIGTLGYRTRTGLGYQVLSYTKHLPITKVLAIDLSAHNNLSLTDWYPDSQTVKGYPQTKDLTQLLADIDVVLLAETPLNYELYSLARKRGIKTAVVANWEFWDYYLHPEYPKPDLIIMPSTWRLEEAQEFGKKWGVKVIQIHHPVDREVFKFRLRDTKKFFHIAGNPAVYDRNGTQVFLQAHPRGIVCVQNDRYAQDMRMRHPQARVYSGIEDPTMMYQMGDILVLPRRYGGNCLPLNEALSSGIPVIMPDISPNNDFLPKEWLVPAKLDGFFVPRAKVDLYSIDPIQLEQKMEWFRRGDMIAQSKLANEIANSISWETLKPKYLEALGGL